jgi:hypothetical protein
LVTIPATPTTVELSISCDLRQRQDRAERICVDNLFTFCPMCAMRFETDPQHHFWSPFCQFRPKSLFRFYLIFMAKFSDTKKSLFRFYLIFMAKFSDTKKSLFRFYLIFIAKFSDTKKKFVPFLSHFYGKIFRHKEKVCSVFISFLWQNFLTQRTVKVMEDFIFYENGT